jgi:hypothetical protein
MKLGEIDIPNSILNLEHDVNVLQQVLDFLMRNNPQMTRPNVTDIENFRKNAIEHLQKKYPSMGIKQK